MRHIPSIILREVYIVVVNQFSGFLAFKIIIKNQGTLRFFLDIRIILHAFRMSIPSSISCCIVIITSNAITDHQALGLN